MFKTSLIPSIRRRDITAPLSPDDVQATVIVARDDEIYDPGHDFLTFSHQDNEKPFYALAVEDLLGFTTDDWIVHGMSVSASPTSPVYWFKGSDFLACLQELGFTEFDYLAEFV